MTKSLILVSFLFAEIACKSPSQTNLKEDSSTQNPTSKELPRTTLTHSQFKAKLLDVSSKHDTKDLNSTKAFEIEVQNLLLTAGFDRDVKQPSQFAQDEESYQETKLTYLEQERAFTVQGFSGVEKLSQDGLVFGRDGLVTFGNSPDLQAFLQKEKPLWAGPSLLDRPFAEREKTNLEFQRQLELFSIIPAKSVENSIFVDNEDIEKSGFIAVINYRLYTQIRLYPNGDYLFYRAHERLRN